MSLGFRVHDIPARHPIQVHAHACAHVHAHVHTCAHMHTHARIFVVLLVLFHFFFYRFLPAAGRTTRRLENFIQVHGLLRAFFFNYLFYFILNIICRVFNSIPQASAGLIFVIVLLIFFLHYFLSV